MPNPVVRAAIGARVHAALQAAKAVQGLEHNAVKGRLREIVIGNLLAPVLGTSFGVGSGVIVDSEGHQSGEIDVIIYNRDIVPPILYGERDGVFPVEACLYAIEVKSVLEVAHLRETFEKFRAIRDLVRLPGGQPHEPIGTLLAFDTRVAAEPDSILHHYNAIDNEVPPLIRVGCVVGRHYWYYAGDLDAWAVEDADAEHSELLTFVGAFANTITSNSTSPIRRGQFVTRPDGGMHLNVKAAIPFGKYIVEHHQMRQVPRNA